MKAYVSLGMTEEIVDSWQEIYQRDSIGKTADEWQKR